VAAEREMILVRRESMRLGMDVYDYDGLFIGYVQELGEADFLVRRRWRRDIRVLLEQVLAVLDRSVVLTARGEEVGTSEPS
jgi:hypothetical protein